MLKPTLLFLATAFAVAQGAETPTATAAGPAAAPVCSQPVFPGNRVAKAKIDAFNTQLKAYGDCVNAFVAQQNTLIAEKEKAIAQLRAEANAAIDAGKRAATEYNDYVKHVNEQIAAH